MSDTLVKGDLRILREQPLNAETPAHLLDDPITPTHLHFIRNISKPPASIDTANWTLTIDGEVHNPLKLSLDELKSRFEPVTFALMLQCAGDGRIGFTPETPGLQFGEGAVACARWTGVRLKDVLEAANLKPGAVYTAHYSSNCKVPGDPHGAPMSRGLPIGKALTENVLIAYEMNGAPLDIQHGAPLRLVVPGWPGSCSQKWLSRIWIRDKVHDGACMTGTTYRMPNRPIGPGEAYTDNDFDIIERLPVKSMITYPRAGATVGQKMQLRGHAWSGDRSVDRLDVSIDGGKSWFPADLKPPVNPGAWQNWSAEITFPGSGTYEVCVRATDQEGEVQPVSAGWNPGGYLNNSIHRITVEVV
ncbi:sulfite oxidase [Roseibium sp. RKSG952]|uniref:sulfite oxidase n=1 Tax=Roseibium sp. RKSG952 TaxID=2529384 RepID=UPI0012BD67FB|nr:sulfite oxidase [Roseibium sp. RKSG952]MTH95782.1 molybdopterin containing oxidoreductase [Roseibium sp. RKSG952]